MNGKGDTTRPRAVSRAAYDEAWERTFGRQSPPTTTLVREQSRGEWHMEARQGQWVEYWEQPQ